MSDSKMTLGENKKCKPVPSHVSFWLQGRKKDRSEAGGGGEAGRENRVHAERPCGEAGSVPLLDEEPEPGEGAWSFRPTRKQNNP